MDDFEERVRLLRERATGLLGSDDGPGVLPGIDALVAEAETSLGGVHDLTLWLLANRARRMLLRDGRDGLEAFDLLIARAAMLPEPNIVRYQALAEKAAALSRMDEDADSAELWRRVLEGNRALLGVEAEQTLSAWWWLARTLRWSGDSERSLLELDGLVPVLERVDGEDAQRTLDALRFRVSDLVALGRDAEALEQTQRILRLETARFGPDAEQPLISRAQIASSLARLGRQGEAVTELESAIRDADAVLGVTSDLPVRLRLDLMRMLVRSDDRGGARAAAIVAARETVQLVEQRHGMPEADEDALASHLERAASELARWAPDPVARLDALREGAEHAERIVGPLHPVARRRLSALAAALLEAERADDALVAYRQLAERETRDAEASASASLGIARSLRAIGMTADAVDMLSGALASAERDGVSANAVSDLREQYALALQELGRRDEAADILRHDVEATGSTSSTINLAVVYLNGDRPADAEAVLRPLKARLVEEGRDRDVEYMRVLGNLALAACRLDRDAEAAVEYDALLELQIAELGPDHRDVLITRHNRALEELHLGRAAEAARRFEQLFRDRWRVLGERSPQTLSTLHSLASALREAGDLPRAAQTARQAYAARAEVLGETHPDTLRSARQLEGILATAGRDEERDAVADAVRSGFSHGEADADARSALRFAEHLLEQGRAADALVEFSRGLRMLPDDAALDILAAERGIASCHGRMNAHAEAAESYGRLAARIERVTPDDRRALAEALDRQGLSLSRTGRIDEAERVQRRAIALVDVETDAERHVVLRARLGRRLAANGRHAEALEAHEETALLAASRLGEEHPLTVDTRDDVAEELLAVGRARESARAYRANAQALVRAFGEGSQRVRRAEANRKAAVERAGRRPRIVLGAVIACAIVACVIWNIAGSP